jgi:isopentenyldiphosphate isomerase
MTDSAAGVELLDVVDDMGRHLGVKAREAVHLDGDWHRVFHCQIVAERAAGPVAVLQRRAKAKAAFPGLLDVSAAGHLAAGETPLDGVRELEEELGVAIDPAALTHLGVRHLVDDSGEGRLNRELTSVFLLRDDRPLEGYVIQQAEVDSVIDVPIPGLLDLLGGRLREMEVTGVAAAGSSDARPVEHTVTLDDLVPGGDYWVTLMVMALRFLRNEHPIAI